MGLLYKIYQSVQQVSEEYQSSREELVEPMQKEDGSELSFTLAELLKHPIGRTATGRE